MGIMKLEYFSQGRQDLNKEVQHHPELLMLLQKHSPEDFELRLAEISTYCGIVLHGDYTKFDLDHLCTLLTKKLYRKRTLIII